MAKLDVKDISSIMFFTGANSLDNALALENREYGYEDEFIGKLTKTASNDSAFNKATGEIFVETPPKYNGVEDLTILAYSYINIKSEIKQINEMYLDDNNKINFRYNYEKDLASDVTNVIATPYKDIKLYINSLNNALYNKQKYYARNNEIEYITYNGIKYYWQKPGTILNESYLRKEHEIGNDYVAYSLISHEMQAETWDAYTYTYVPVFDTVKNNETGETTQVPVMETRYEVEYLYRIGEVIDGKLNEIVNRYNELYEKDNFCSYYLYNLNHKLSLIANTYSFGKQTFDIYSNYDGEFNNWFNNVISFNVGNLESTENIKLANVILGEEYWTNMTIDENKFICGDSIKHEADKDIEMIATLNSYNTSDIRILAPYKIKKLDLSVISDKLTGTLDLTSNYDKKIDFERTVNTNWQKEKGSLLEELIIGKESINCNITDIVGLHEMTNLKKLDITGCNKLNNIELTNLSKLEEVIATGTNIIVYQPAQYSTIKNIILPNTIENIILDDITVDGVLQYEPTERLTSLEINNVKGFDSYEFVSKWLTILKDNNMLSSGNVNFVNLNGVEWDNVSVNKLVDLNNIELNEFTGNINIVGEFTKYISRLDYRLLYNLYGGDVFTENNPLKFNVNLVDNAFKINVKFEIPETVMNENVEITTYKEIGNFDIDVLDTITGNSLLNDIQMNPDLYNHITLDKFINNKKNIGLFTQLTTLLESNEKSEYIKNLEIGDVLLYVDKVVIVSKNTENINTNYIKLGKIEDIETLSSIFTSIRGLQNYVVTFDAIETIYDAPIEEPTEEVTEEPSEEPIE